MSRYLVLALLAAGCGSNLYLSDDEGAPRPKVGAFDAHPDELSLPYALGTQVVLSVKSIDEAAAGWKIVSDSPAVFAVADAIADGSSLQANGRAMAEGSARVRVLDANGSERRSAQVSVRAADRARIFVHGTLRVMGRDESSLTAAEVTSANVLVGGKAVFAVAYLRGSERLYGRGIAEIEMPAAITVENRTTAGVTTNEWLFIKASQPGLHEVKVKQGSTVLATLPLTALPESELAGVSLAEESNASKNDKDEVWVLARARDTMGREVLGVYTNWTLDGVAQVGKDGTMPDPLGDLYRYRYAPDKSPRTLVASRGALSTNLMVRAHDGYVSNTTYLGCSAAPGRARSVLSILPLAFLLLAISRRARGSRRSSS